MVRTSREKTIKNIEESGEKVILMPQDTTTLDYIGLKECEGLGSYYNEKSRGCFSKSKNAAFISGKFPATIANSNLSD